MNKHNKNVEEIKCTLSMIPNNNKNIIILNKMLP